MKTYVLMTKLAPEVAAKISMISRANGAIIAESWTAIPYKRIVELAKEV